MKDATNKTARHTPGEVKRIGCPGGAILWIEDADGNEVLRVRANGYDDEADAARRIRLYAAAPDLLAACEMLMATAADLVAFRDKDDTLRVVNDTGDRIAYSGAVIDERIAAARSAIARAKGGVS